MTSKFPASGEGGRQQFVLEWTTFHRAQTIDDEGWLAVNKVYRTSLGDPLEALEDGTFQNLRTDERLKRTVASLMDPAVVIRIISAMLMEVAILRRRLKAASLQAWSDTVLACHLSDPKLHVRLLAAYRPYIHGNYMCPRCAIDTGYRSKLSVHAIVSGGPVFKCSSCDFESVPDPLPDAAHPVR